MLFRTQPFYRDIFPEEAFLSSFVIYYTTKNPIIETMTPAN